VVYAWDLEQTCKFQRCGQNTDSVLDRLIVVESPIRAGRIVGPSSPDNQLASGVAEPAEIRVVGIVDPLAFLEAVEAVDGELPILP
jgi:hypothetical protein